LAALQKTNGVLVCRSAADVTNTRRAVVFINIKRS
jgi:hypothetical protein